MRLIDRVRFNNLNPEVRRSFLGNICVKNRFLVFEDGDENAWEKAKLELKEKGINNIDLDAFIANAKNEDGENVVPENLVEAKDIVNKIRNGEKVTVKDLSKVLLFLWDSLEGK